MVSRYMLSVCMGAIFGLGAMENAGAAPDREYNGPYTGAHLNRVAFPIGGMGAGMFCLEGTGAISHMSVRNQMEFFHEPCTFAALCVKGDENVARVLEGPIPDWKYFGRAGTGNGATGTTYGLPRFDKASFEARFPFGAVTLGDADIPFEVSITGWSPFTPGDSDNSCLPVGALEYRFRNNTGETREAVFSFNTKNFMAAGKGKNGIAAFPNGFELLNRSGSDENTELDTSFAVFVDDPNVVVDHCWFKGGWWDALTLAWRNVAEGILLDNPAVEGSSPGASLFVPFTLKPGEEKVVRLMTAWYAPSTKIHAGKRRPGPAFASGPSAGTAAGQQEVTGFLGKGLVNTFDPSGDAPTGTLTSPPIEIAQPYVHFLIAGGNRPGKICVELLVENEVVRTTTGDQTETLKWASWDVSDLVGQKAHIRIADRDSSSWGHICADHIIFADKPIAALKAQDSNEIRKGMKVTVFEDFERKSYGDWIADPPVPAACCASGAKEGTTHPYYKPWYAQRFGSVEEVSRFWERNYEKLRAESALFRDTFYDTSLPAEVVEAVAANLTILKSPTVLRQTDGRLWNWEGCCDGHGCCHGSCTHVWNYAQAIPHLFPDLERTLRQTEFNENMYEDGRQAFRANLPVSPASWGNVAADGQLGGVMKVYREWRISGDTAWMKSYWPKVKLSLDYIISSQDPRETGLLEESHHNTYDINYFGPDGHCGTFYLGALTAAIRMGETAGADVSRYRSLLGKGIKRLEAELYNGEYFYQQIMTEGLNSNPPKLDPSTNCEGYRPVVELLNEQGPKYQYGTGCLSDGVLGLWIARVCGLDEEIIDQDKVRSNLKAIHRYNLKRDLSGHANPQRPTFAMGDEGGLLLCTWPKGGALAIPFVYSDEVWTGIEYQVASHLMLEGMVEEGLEIVRVCRDRYDGVRRNPFNEYECGHWYARALASYGLLQGLTGARYDAVDDTLYIDSQVGDFRSFLCTATGYGTVGLQNGKPFLEVKAGKIRVKRVMVSGKEMKL